MPFQASHDSQSQPGKFEAHNRMEQLAQPEASVSETTGTQPSRVAKIIPSERYNWKVEVMLDAASNTLQQLMQLLYLLGRDPDVPKDARHHVTAAQAEIALLSRFMKNSVEERSMREEQPPARGGALAAGNP
jgi:hypothetical protein